MIQSDQIFVDVEPSTLLAGLKKIRQTGITAEMAAYIAGPVLKALEVVAKSPDEDSIAALDEVRSKLARKISRR